MKKLWLLIFALLAAFPAFADTEQEPGLPYRTSMPYPVRYPNTDTKPGASIAIGAGALAKQYIPAQYQNLAIGSGALAGTMTNAAVGNFALGYQACPKVTSGTLNVCIGNSTGSLLTTGFSNLLVGTGAGSGMTAGTSYNIIFDASNPASPCTTCNASTQIGSGTGRANVGSSVVVGYNAGFNDTTGGSFQTIVGANVGLNNVGNGTSDSTLILIGANANSGAMLDSATTTSNTFIGIGQGLPGTGDTMVGWGALAANTVNSANQVAFGYQALAASIDGTFNSAFGYQACSTITHGTNNVCFGYQVGSATLTTGNSNILIGTSSGVTTPASGTSNYLNIGNMIVGDTSHGSLILEGPTTVVSSCGGSPSLKAGSNDMGGEVTVGSAATSCTISFSNTKNAAPVCVISAQTALTGLAYTISTTALVVSATGLGGDIIDYKCAQVSTSTNPTP